MTSAGALAGCSGGHAKAVYYTQPHSDSDPLEGSSYGLLGFPPEILLHIRTQTESRTCAYQLTERLKVSYLDVPDLALIARVVPDLASLTSDPVLHRYRLLIVSPSRVSHNLFGKGPQGIAFRPTVPDLVHRGVLRGHGIERQWRMGAYFYSKSVSHSRKTSAPITTRA